jgi:hypothetical protein
LKITIGDSTPVHVWGQYPAALFGFHLDSIPKWLASRLNSGGIGTVPGDQAEALLNDIYVTNS